MDGKVHSAKELAQENEVSTKTIQRGINVLESAGVFTESIKGKYGGYKLDPACIPQLSTIKPIELGELLSVLKHKENILGKNKTLSHIEEVLINSTNRNSTKEIISTSSKIILDSIPWGKCQASLKSYDKIYNACFNQTSVEFDYITYEGKTSRRTVNPYCLTLKDGSWYTYGEDTSDETLKLFKLSRTSNIENTSKSFTIKNSIDIYSMPWNEYKSQDMNDIILEIKKSCANEINDWLDYKIISETNDTITVNAKIKDSMDFYEKLVSSSTKIKLIEPVKLVEKLLTLCKNVENLYRPQEAYK